MKTSSQKMLERSQNSILANPVKLLYLLIPYLIMLIVGSATMGIGDTLHVMHWYTVLLALGLVTLPISSMLFRNSISAGFFLAQPLGIIMIALVVWTGTYIGIMRFNLFFLYLTILIVFAISYFIPRIFRPFLKKLSQPMVYENMIIEASIFALVLTILCFYKGFLPDINGQEKFMDYGFIMSMLRNSKLPANDMWMAGKSINYYYFGQYIYALLIKLSGIYSGIGYNLAMCSAIAIPFSMCYSIGTMIIESSKEFGMRCGKVTTYLGGLLSAFTVMIFGNSHSFYYDPNSLGNGLLNFFSGFGINVGTTDNFFYPDSTRYIGHNPDSRVFDEFGNITDFGDYTIHEFPFYSFLVGDLHAHVVSTMIVLLIMGLCVSLITRKFALTRDIPFTAVSGKSVKAMVSEMICPEFIAISILLGVAQMTNYWDFLIYFIFCSMTLFVVNTRKSEAFSSIIGAITFGGSIIAILGIYLIAGNSPYVHVLVQLFALVMITMGTVVSPCALTRTSMGMSFLFSVAHIVALPFNANFDMISNSLGKSTHHSTLFQLFILYGTHVFIALAFIVSVIITKNYRYITTKSRKRKASVSQVIDGYSEYPNPVAKFFGERNPLDVFVCGMIVVAFMLILAPEIFYVRDIYTSGYLRSNTMFKFAYAAFIILSMAVSYAIVRMFWMVGKNGYYNNFSYSVAIISCLLLFVPAHYTGVALQQRSGDLHKENYKTLDGTAYIETWSSNNTTLQESGNLKDYMEVVNWCNENISGAPNIIEADGLSYTDNNFVSAYTGLPTVCGWQTHEWLWRFHGIVDKETDLLISDPERDVWQLYLNPRYADIRTFYTSGNPADLRAIADKYDVEYIIMGDLERAKFGMDNSATIYQMAECVYSSGSVSVFHYSAQ